MPSDLASVVARRLLAASAADDPEVAYQHAQEARRLAARVGIVRETTGIAAYRAGHWAEALAELRAARRLTGRTSYLPMIADSERALGRIDRALGVIAESTRHKLDRATEVELRIVESGIRRDQGLADAAVVVLQLPELKERRTKPWSARLFYAYADALLDAGRTEQAREWFARAAAADHDEQTDAAERFDDLDDIVIDDLSDEDEDDYDEDEEDGPDAADDLADDDLPSDEEGGPPTADDLAKDDDQDASNDEDATPDTLGRDDEAGHARRQPGRRRPLRRRPAPITTLARPRMPGSGHPAAIATAEPRQRVASPGNVARGADVTPGDEVGVSPDGWVPRSAPLSDAEWTAHKRRGGQDGWGVLSSQCTIPATLEAVLLSVSNLAASAGSASGPSAAYRSRVR